MEILICQQPQIVSGNYLMNFHPFGACDGSLESSNPTLFNHMGTSHFNTSYSIRSCSFLSKIFLLILTGSIASKGIPDDIPDPLGKSVTTTTTVDANLNLCLATGRSVTRC